MDKEDLENEKWIKQLEETPIEELIESLEKAITKLKQNN